MNLRFIQPCGYALMIASVCGAGCSHDESPQKTTPAGVPCVEPFVRSCLDDTHIESCVNGLTSPQKCAENWHCASLSQGATCYPDEVSTCSDGNKSCSPGDEILACTQGKWQPTGTICEFGCRDGLCLNARGQFDYQCDEGRLICDGLGTVLTCVQGAWSMAESPCPYRCQNGKCVDAPKVNCTPDACSGTCQNDICVTGEMQQIQLGDTCDPDVFVEFCRDDQVVACQFEGTEQAHVVIKRCDEEGGCSVVLHEDAAGRNRLRAFCKGRDANQCRENGQKIFHCTTSEDSSRGAYFHETYQECMQNTDGSYTLLNSTDAVLFGYCSDAGCDRDGRHCIELEEPYYCDYHQRCTDKTGFDYCIDRGVNGIFTGHETCTNGTVCTDVQGVADCYAGCQEEGRKRSVCQTRSSGSVQVTFTCLRGRDGRLYEVKTAQTLAEGCPDEPSSCAGKEMCDACSEPQLEACQTQYHPSFRCALDLKGNPQCLSSCSTAGKTSAYCMQKECGEYVEGNNLFYHQSECVPLSDGSMGLWVTETQCPESCDDDKGCG